MMSSMAVQYGLANASFISQKPSLDPLRTTKPISLKRSIVALAAPVTTLTVEPDAANDDSVTRSQKLELSKVAVKQEKKPKLVLKFIWMEKNIGLALNQIVPGHGTIPLSPYFFWPRKDAWKELNSTLQSKPWISQKKKIILLNQATDIINLWQQSGGYLTSQ